MFNRHTLQVKLVKSEQPTPAYGLPKSTVDLVKHHQMAQETVAFCAVTFVAVYAAKTLLSTASQIAVITAETRIN